MLGLGEMQKKAVLKMVPSTRPQAKQKFKICKSLSKPVVFGCFCWWCLIWMGDGIIADYRRPGRILICDHQHCSQASETTIARFLSFPLLLRFRSLTATEIHRNEVLSSEDTQEHSTTRSTRWSFLSMMWYLHTIYIYIYICIYIYLFIYLSIYYLSIYYLSIYLFIYIYTVHRYS